MQKSIHHEERVLCVRFERDEQIENTLKKIPGCRWSQTMKCWYLPNTTPHFRQVLEKLRPFTYVDFSEVVKKTEVVRKEKTPIPNITLKPTPTTQLNEPVQQEIEKFMSWLKSKRYSSNTIKTYTEALRTFGIVNIAGHVVQNVFRLQTTAEAQKKFRTYRETTSGKVPPEVLVVSSGFRGDRVH